MHKPVFDDAVVVSFAAMGADQVDAVGNVAGIEAGTTGRKRKAGKKADADRSGLTLMLLPEVVARLRAEAERKGRTIDQVVEKLVHKHLGKH
jgi:hypothetical protein